MPASQDFRDGAASAASAIVVAVARIENYGVPITVDVVRNVAAQIRYTMGGQVFELWPDEASASTTPEEP